MGDIDHELLDNLIFNKKDDDIKELANNIEPLIPVELPRHELIEFLQKREYVYDDDLDTICRELHSKFFVGKHVNTIMEFVSGELIEFAKSSDTLTHTHEFDEEGDVVVNVMFDWGNENLTTTLVIMFELCSFGYPLIITNGVGEDMNATNFWKAVALATLSKLSSVIPKNLDKL